MAAFKSFGKAGGEESWLVEEGDDGGEDRQKWVCTKCPDSDNCSKSSFADANLVSYISEQVCREYISKHLVGSGKHQMQKDQADYLADQADVECETETWQQREFNRNWLKNHQEQKDAQRHTPRAGAQRNIGKRDSEAAGLVVVASTMEKLAKTVGTLVHKVDGLAQGGDQDSSGACHVSFPKPPMEPPPSTLAIGASSSSSSGVSMREVRALATSLEHNIESMQIAVRTLIAACSTLGEEARKQTQMLHLLQSVLRVRM